MNGKNPDPAIEQNESLPVWHTLAFDPTTNFSLLGWILDKFMQNRRPGKTLDLNLDAGPPESKTN